MPGPSELDYNELSSFAYSGLFDEPSENIVGKPLQYVIDSKLNSSSSAIHNIPSGGEHTTPSEWYSDLNYLANSDGLRGYVVKSVETNPYDGGSMICLENPTTGHDIFLFEGTCCARGWKEDAYLLKEGMTSSQKRALEFIEDHARDGFDYTYIGHSKGGSQAATGLIYGGRGGECFAFDAPGDDPSMLGMDIEGLHYISNKNCPVAALGPKGGDERYVWGTSDDPAHKGAEAGLLPNFEAHGPANLRNYRAVLDANGNPIYDEYKYKDPETGKVLTRRVLRMEVSDPDDASPVDCAWYVPALRGITQGLWRLPEDIRTYISDTLGSVLPVLLDKTERKKFLNTVSKWCRDHPLQTAACLIVAIPIVVKVAPYVLGVVLPKIAAVLGIDFILKELDKFYMMIRPELCKLIKQFTEVIQCAIEFVADLSVQIAKGISEFFQVAYEKALAWTKKVIDYGRNFFQGVGDFFGGIGTFLSQFFSGGPKVYDFSDQRLTDLRNAQTKYFAVAIASPMKWTTLHAGERFMARLSLGSSQQLIRSAFNNEESLAKNLVDRIDRAFKKAADEDSRFAAELSGMNRAVASATALLA